MIIQVELDVNKIHPNPRNRNVHTEEDIMRLANNIKAYDLINPITVRSIGCEQYQIVVGEGRWKAFKKLGRKTIPARVMDAGINEVIVDGMRLSENQIRTFDFLSECQELANLHRQNKSYDVLSREFGNSSVEIARKVEIGYFPEPLMHAIRNGKPRRFGKETTWTLGSLRDILTLRKGNGEYKIGRGRKEYDLFPEEIDYSEVELTVRKVNQGQIEVGEELRAYVAERRIVLEEASRERQIQFELVVIQQELNTKFQQEEEQLKTRLGKDYESKIEEVQNKLGDAIAQAQHAREERARMEAEHASAVRKVREEISSAHRAEISAKEKSYSEQIDRLRKEIQQAREAQTNALRDAEAKLRKEYERKIATAEAAAGKTKEEVERSQEVIKSLRAELNERVAKCEREIKEEYQRKISEKLAETQGVIAERDRWKKEAETLSKQLKQQADRVAELAREHKEQLSAKDNEITARDARIAKLLQMRAELEAEITKKSKEEARQEAKREAAEYKSQLQKEFEEKLAAIEKSFAKREQELKLKTNKTLDDAINRFMQLSNELDASMRLLVYDYLEHLKQQQLSDISVRMQWISRKVTDAIDAIEQLQTQTIDL